LCTPRCWLRSTLSFRTMAASLRSLLLSGCLLSVSSWLAVIRSVPAARCSVVMADGVTCVSRKLPKSAVAVDISIPDTVSKQVYDKVIKELSKGAKVDGYRPGKAPVEAVIAKVGMKKVKGAVVEQIVDVGMKQAGNQIELRTVGEARLHGEMDALVESYAPGAPLDFTVLADVYPEVPLTPEMYTGLHVEVEKVPFNQEAYDTALNKLRDQHADVVEAEEGTPAEEGMQLRINMVGYAATPEGARGEELPPVAGGDGVELRLQPGRFMPGLVEGLVGIKAGEERDISVTFPARTSVPELAGKQAVFAVSCEKVQRRVLPFPSDDFADKVKTGMSWTELDEKLKEGVQQEADEILKKSTQLALERAMLKKLPASFEVPDSLLEDVSKERFAGMLAEMREQGQTDEQLKELITKENYENFLKISAPMSAMRVKADFALGAISQREGLEVKRDDVDDEVMTLQAQALQRGEKFKESEVRPKVQATLERNMVLDWMQSQSTVELVDAGSLPEVTPEELLGASPEELAAQIKEDKELAAKAVAEPAAEAAPEVVSTAEVPESADESEAASDEEAASNAPNGYEWGGTF